MKSKNRVIKVARVLTKLMSDREGIQVTVSGSTAFSCGGRINIPFGDFTDPDYVSMTHGYIDHEIGHEKHTCFSVNYKSKLHSNLCNIFEDARMEKLVGAEYPGAKLNLEKLVLLAIKKGLFCEPKSSENPLSLVLTYCLYKGRVLGAGNLCLDEYAEQALAYLRYTYDNNFIVSLTEIVHKITNTRSTRDCASMAWEVIELMKNTEEEQEEPENGDDSDDSSGDNANDEQSNGEQSNGEQSDDEQSDGEQSDGSSTGTNESKTSAETQENGNQPSSSIKSVLQAIEDDNVEVADFHEKIAEILGQEAEKFNPSKEDSDIRDIFSNALPVTTRCVNMGLPFKSPELIPSAGKAVYRSLHRALIDETEELNGFRNRGRKLSSKKLVGSTLGDDRIFKTPVVENELSAAISILVDSSGSMAGGYQEIANAVALAMSKGLQSLHVTNEIGFYSSEMHLYIAKPYNQKHIDAKRFQVCSDVYTPSGEAMKSALMRLYRQPESKKCLFLVTDGEPSCPESFLEALELAKLFGISVAVLGVGMGRETIDGLNEKHFTKIECVSNLKSALSKIVKANLF